MKIPQRHSGLARIRILVSARMTTSGFTLLELMVVIAITGILTGAGIVSFMGSKQSTAVRLAAENFAQFLRTTEGMTRSGATFPGGASQRCDDGSIPIRSTNAPCGGWGVVVVSGSYDRFADTQNVLLRQKDAGDPSSTNDHMNLPDNVTITPANGPATVIFVPPKDAICVNDNRGMQCGPQVSEDVTWTLQYSGTSYQRTVKLNTVSGSVTVE